MLRGLIAYVGAIRIDGDLDDPGWAGASRATGFAEVEPGDQVRPPVDSEAWVTYDETSLYLALIAHDDPKSVRVSLRERDQIWSDDYFGLMLDTYGDRAWAYELFVNPLGIQGDLRMLSSGQEEIAMDLVWISEGKVTEVGYQVEIAIPFASLRFPDREEQTFRANFWRDHQRDVRRRYAWAAIDRDDPCWMCNWGTIRGIRGITRSKSLDLIGSWIAYTNGRLANADDPTSPFRREETDGEASVSVRYGISSDVSAEIAVNPDFSQIESDAGEIDVNNPFAIFYPERRPFFQEGSDLTSTPIDAIYTRSIHNPLFAGKLTGRRGRLSFGYTIARDEDSPVVLPQEERSYFRQAGRSVSNLLRIRRTVGEESHVGLLLTDRRLEGGGSGTTFGVDASLRFLGNYRASLQDLASFSREPDDTTATAGLNGIPILGARRDLGFNGEEFWGRAMHAALSGQGRRWAAEVEFSSYSPTFRADNGFVTRSDFRSLNLWTGLPLRPNRRWLVSCEPSVSVGRMWSHAGRFEDEWLRPGVGAVLPMQTQVRIEALWSAERFREQVFDGIRTWKGEISSRFGEGLAGGIEVRTGRLIWRTFSGTPVLGRSREAEIELTFRPTMRLEIQPSAEYSRMRTPDDRARIFEEYILRTRLLYQFDRQLSGRVVAEYVDSDATVRLEPLLTYRPGAFTVLYLGMSGRLLRFGPESGSGARPWKLHSGQLFAKLQYLYQV